MLKRRIPTNDVLKRIGISIVSRCLCCVNGGEETLVHLFLTTPIAVKLWRYFITCVGLNMDGQNLSTIIVQWRNHAKGLREKMILRAIPAIILWELWKNRNKIKNGKVPS